MAKQLTEEEIGARLRLRGRATFVRDADAAGDAIQRLARRTEHASVVGRIGAGVWRGLARGAMAAARVVTTGATLMAGAAALVGGAFVKMGIETMVAWEQSTIAFTTMLGDSQMAVQMMDKLRTFAIATPFEMPQLIQGARNLRAMGWEAGQLIPTLQIIGDSAAALGHDSEGVVRIGRALGEMRAKGFASGEEMRQLANHGIRAWEYLAESVGKSIPKTMEMAEKRQISGAQAISAIMAGMAKEHGGMMEAQMTTIGGKWMMLKDTVRFAAMDMVMPFKEDLGNAMTRAIELAERFGARVAEIAPGAVAIFKWGLQGGPLSDTIDTMNGRLYYLGFLLRALKERNPATFWRDLSDSIQGLIDPTGKWTHHFERVGDVASDVWEVFRDGILPVFRDLSPALKGVLNPLTLLDDAFSWMADNTRTVRTTVQVLLAVFAGFAALRIYTRLIVGFANGVQRAKDSMTAARDATRLLRNGVRAVPRGLKAMAIGMKNATVATARFTVAVVKGTAALVKKAAIATASAAKFIVVAVATKVWAAAQWLLNAAFIANPLVAFVTILTLLAVGIYTAYKRSETFRRVITGGFEAVKNIAKSVLDWLGRNWPLLLGILTGPFGLAVVAITRNFESILGAFKRVINTIIRGWNNLEFKLPSFKGIKVAGKTIIPGWEGSTISTPNIPMLGHGGKVTSGGTAVVGERGPEVVSLGVGAKVVPLTDERVEISNARASDSRRAVPARLQVTDGGRVLFELIREVAGDTAARY
jgi:tape measure domain-containing protein